jgi:hypothetical protein
MIAVAWGAIKSLFGGFSLRAWLIASAVIAFGLWTWRAYGAGYDKADAMWRAKALEARIAKLELELKVQKQADAAESQLRAELEAENEQQKKVIDDYLAELDSRADKCLLGPDARRLQ